MTDINKTLQKIEKRADMLVKDIKEETDEFTSKSNIELPDFEEVQQKGVLYKGYREVTRANDRINRLLVRIGDTIVGLKGMKADLRDSDNIPPKALKRIRIRLDKSIRKLKSYQDILEKEKDSYSQALRFYHSAQYILGSPRLSGMSD